MTLTRYFVAFALGWSLTFSLSSQTQAASPETAPPELKNLINQIESAANEQNLAQVLKFYSPEFTTPDGLTYDTFKNALSQLWERYPNLQYSTQLQSWQQDRDQWIVDTLTKVQGTGNYQGREMKLEANLTSRQYFKNGKLIRQEILQERTDITSGTQPPEVNVNLPKKVKVKESFDFDVILKEPLGDDLLAGTAIEEIAQPDSYLAANRFELQLLKAGGLFKRATATNTSESHWLSAILIQPDGLRLVTQRLQIEDP